MKPEQQRISIAEACGWTRPFANTDWKWHDPSGKMQEDWGRELSCPDYLNDLNAMHEAENSEALCKISYTSELYVVQSRRNPHVGSTEFTALVNSSAAQRAEAFLRTLGLWTEDQP